MKFTSLAIVLFITSALSLTACETSEVIDLVEEPELTEMDLQSILDLAYLDEMKAEATYEQVMTQFGVQRPFSNIVNAEIRHSQSVLGLYDQYEMTAPEFDGIGVLEFASVQEACSIAVVAEEENIALYDELIAQIEEQDVVNVFEGLRSASLDKHLPAFQKCE